MNREETLFEQALAYESPAAREAYLREACAGEEPLFQSLQALLRIHDRAGKFLDPDSSFRGTPLFVAAERGSASPSENPGDRIGRYKLLEKIGEGGCGIVYMAEQEEPVRRRVALKVIRLGMDTKAVVARFEAERQALALMDHPNIAKVLDAGATETGRPYFVMELVRGTKITEFCDHNNLSTHQRLDLFMEVCRAIQHAHQKGIIHRDIKPSNTLVTLHDGAPVPKVIDFGIAKATAGRLTDKTLFTAFQQFIGTPAYMSPEQAEMSGLDIDTRSDIYSLGVLLYELLTGKTPFDSKEILEAGLDAMRRTIREEEPPRPSTKLSTMLKGELTTTASLRQTEPPQLLHAVHGDLDWIVMKCLEKDRSRRYETANDLARDIQRHLSREPVLACPPSNWYRLGKTVQRHRGAFAAAAIILVLLVAGVAASTWEAVKARRAEREQARLRHQAEALSEQETRLRQDAQASAVKAQASEKKAQTEAAKSERVAQFLKDMLKGVNPSKALGRDTTMLKEILDKTANSLDQGVTNEPEVEIDLRGVLVETYRDLGLFNQAEKMALAAVQVARSSLGEKQVAETLVWLGDAQRQLGKLPEAETTLQEALALCRKQEDQKSEMLAQCLNNLALVFWDRGRPAQAEPMFGEALVIYKERLGKDQPEVAQGLNNLGLALRDERKFTEAEAAFREALAVSRKTFGEDSPEVMLKLSNLGLVVGDQGRTDDAVKLYREALKIARKVLPKEHPDLGWICDNLGVVLRKQGNAVEAESLQREALALQRKTLGDAHPDVALSLNNLAVTLLDLKKFDEAQSLDREALAVYRKIYGEDHPKVASSLFNLAVVLERAGNLAEAEDFCRQSLALRRKILPKDHPDLAASLDILGNILLDLGKPAEAEESLREALAIHEKATFDDFRTFCCRSLLGGALLGQKKYTDAEPLLLSGYQGLKQQEAKISKWNKPLLRKAIQRLATFYEETGKADQRAEWKEKLIQFDKAAR